jgi:hypothetical protein
MLVRHDTCTWYISAKVYIPYKQRDVYLLDSCDGKYLVPSSWGISSEVAGFLGAGIMDAYEYDETGHLLQIM